MHAKRKKDPEQLKERKKARAQAHYKQEKERKAKMTPEQIQEEKDSNESRKLYNRQVIKDKKRGVESRKLAQREIKILTFMKKTKVEYHHHSQVEFIDVQHGIDTIKETLSEDKKNLKKHNDHQCEYYPKSNMHMRYDSYIWNRQGEGNNHMPISWLGCIFSSSFDSIYDVPLDGTYKFQKYDSGERGLGSYHRLTAIKVEAEAHVPKVDPGAYPPITAN